MDTVTLDVKNRDLSVKASDLRGKSILPIEYYGRGVKNKSLQADYQSFRRIYKSAGGNTIIKLKLDGDEEVNALVHDVMYDPVSDKIVHVDMINVKMDEVLHTQVPLAFTGVAPAVKELAGTLMTNITEIDVKCLPKDLIHKIEVNVDSLVDFHSFIRVKDLVVPATITVLNSPEDVVATVAAPAKEEEEVKAPAAGEGVEGAAVAEGGAEGEVKEGEAAKEEKPEGESKSK
ncbi:MAG: 50S ribosomal protein L25 [Candidatus Peregrinibacteria bacterium]